MRAGERAGRPSPLVPPGSSTGLRDGRGRAGGGGGGDSPEPADLPEVGEHLAAGHVFQHHVEVRVVLWGKKGDSTNKMDRTTTAKTKDNANE